MQTSSLGKVRSVIVCDRLPDMHNFAQFLVAIVKLLTAIAIVWYWGARAQLLTSVLSMPEILYIVGYHSVFERQLHTVGATRTVGH